MQIEIFLNQILFSQFGRIFYHKETDFDWEMIGAVCLHIIIDDHPKACQGKVTVMLQPFCSACCQAESNDKVLVLLVHSSRIAR